jgi:hypothetical protein
VICWVLSGTNRAAPKRWDRWAMKQKKAYAGVMSYGVLTERIGMGL